MMAISYIVWDIQILKENAAGSKCPHRATSGCTSYVAVLDHFFNLFIRTAQCLAYIQWAWR